MFEYQASDFSGNSTSELMGRIKNLQDQLTASEAAREEAKKLVTYFQADASMQKAKLTTVEKQLVESNRQLTSRQAQVIFVEKKLEDAKKNCEVFHIDFREVSLISSSKQSAINRVKRFEKKNEELQAKQKGWEQLAEAREHKLEKYGRHLPDCSIHETDVNDMAYGKCSCGLTSPTEQG